MKTASDYLKLAHMISDCCKKNNSSEIIGFILYVS